ncbi:hypothetical protein BGX26_010818 [Mortierella sp. AD094]|nr:hypothetical protein BGX26_010818 [Mortierella sp. AD094]
MGNSKSRHAHSAGPSRKHAKHSSSHSIDQRYVSNRQSHNSNNNLNTSNHNNHNSNNYYNNYNHISSTDAFSGQLVPNDSGHYSTHGSLAPITQLEFPGGSFHQNLSSSGRLDLQAKTSDSSLQLQYGSRVKRAPPPVGGSNGGAGVGGGGIAGNGFGTVSTNGGYANGGPIRTSGTGTHTYADFPGVVDPYGSGIGYNIGYNSTLEMTSPHLQHENETRPNSLRASHGRISSLGQTQQTTPQLQQQQQYSNTAFQPHQQYHPAQRVSSRSPTPMGGHREDDTIRGDSRIPSLSALTIGINDGGNSARYGHGNMQQHNARYQQQQQQQQEYIDPTFVQRPAYQINGIGNSGTPVGGIVQGRQPQPDVRTSRNTNGTSAAVAAVAAAAPPRVSEIFANAGPLLDSAAVIPSASASSSRPLAADQVFARLAKQNPTNPRETDKRERIFRWLDDIAKALTFNPDTSIPGWIIPVAPDEHDQPDSPYYLDRITYELDLMAPVGRPFRKAIDINCSSGEWAMDLALKNPRTIVYAVDPLLDVSRVPPRIPENCRFKLRDVKDQEGEFDLVHQRLGAFRTQILEWTPHFAELGRLTRPGGWIQLAECNGMIVRAGVESLKVNRWVEKAALSSGLNPMQMVDALMPTILGAGLINVECYEYGIPLGDWAGRRGLIAMRSYLVMVESLRDEIIEMNRLEEGIFEETIELMKIECSVDCAELIMKVICAQKPPFTDDIWR